MKHIKVLLVPFIIWATLCFNIGNVKGIIGGKDVTTNHFRYQISLQTNDEHICGGVIINKQYVLTAANCLIGSDEQFIKRKYVIVAGVNNLKDEESDRVEVNVEKIFVPTEFKRTNTGNPSSSIKKYYPIADLAVLKVEKDLLKLNPSLKVAKLPKMNLQHPNYEGSETLISGFGIENFNNRDGSNGYGQYCSKLRFAAAHILQQKTCSLKLKFDLDKKHLCAEMVHHVGHIIEGVCDGDVGGPLILQGTAIIGILSQHSSDCNEKYHPALYTRIPDFMYFIKDALNDEFKDGMRMAYYTKKEIDSDRNEDEEEELTEMFRFI